MKTNQPDGRTPEEEPFAMLFKRVLQAPSDRLTPSAKLVYAVLNGMPAARRGGHIFITKAQIARDSGISERSVYEAVKQLDAARLIEVTKEKTIGPASVNRYRVLDVRRSTLAPLHTHHASSARVREVVSEHQTRRQAGSAQTLGNLLQDQQATIAGSQAVLAGLPGNTCPQKEEKAQEGQEGRGKNSALELNWDGHELEARIHDEGLEGVLEEIQERLLEALEVLQELLRSGTSTLSRCQALVTEAWDTTRPASENVTALHSAALRQAS